MTLWLIIASGTTLSLFITWIAHKRLVGPQEARYINRLQTVVERLEKAVTHYEQQITTISQDVSQAKNQLCNLGDIVASHTEKLEEIHKVNKDFRLIIGPLMKGVLKSGRAKITVEYDENDKLKVDILPA